jgi:toxin CptA
MHNAPSVSYPVGRCALARRLWMWHTVFGLVLWLAWGWAQDSQGPAQGIWWGTGALWALIAYAGWRESVCQSERQPTLLHWEGRHWCLDEDARIGRVKAVWDVQSNLLLHWQPLSFTPGCSGRWLWVTRSACPELWQDVRRAVYSPHR